MIKTTHILQLILSLVFMVSLLVIYPLPTKAAELSWSKVNLPANGAAGKWVLARNSDVRLLTIAADGTLYCWADPDGTANRLFKSMDGGYSWSFTGKVTGDIVDIAVAPGNPQYVFYATQTAIFESIDAGVNFKKIVSDPISDQNLEITCLSAVALTNGLQLAVGTRGVDEGNGSVFLLKAKDNYKWVDQEVGRYDVYAVAFSPNYAIDGQLIAVCTVDGQTIITTQAQGQIWNTVLGDAIIQGIVPKSAEIAFAADYNVDPVTGKSTFYLGVNGDHDQGGAFRVKFKNSPLDSSVIDLGVDVAIGDGSPDISSIAVSGNAAGAFVMVGTADSGSVLYTGEDDQQWAYSDKPPTGESDTWVVLSNDFANSGIALAATSGRNSAVSISRTGGISWNQISLIDTNLTQIVDLAISTDYAEDSTLIMLTSDMQDDLWLSASGGERWERVYSVLPDQPDRLHRVVFSPNFKQNKTVYFQATSNSRDVVYKSVDGCQNFSPLAPYSSWDDEYVTINNWIIAPDDTIFVVGFDSTDTAGTVYRTTGKSLLYDFQTEVGGTSINSIVLSPNFTVDKTVLIGNNQGEVYYSRDGGRNFDKIPLAEDTNLLSGAISVAFDPNFANNKIVYAANADSSKPGIFHYVIGKSTVWESIDSSLPDNAGISQIATSDRGNLYAIYTLNLNGVINQGGLERSINPTLALGPSFESVTKGLANNGALSGLWIRGNTLWTIDSTNSKLLTYSDSISSPVMLKSPENKASGLDPRNNVLSWQSLEGATNYHWQIDTDTDFSSIASGFEGDTDSISVQLPALETDTQYFWRVRATAPVASAWSEKLSFTTRLSSTVVASQLTDPKVNESASIQPKFVWTILAGADRYELIVAKDAAFSQMVIDKTGANALSANAWKSDTTLEYGQTYYWKVRAVNSHNASAWSAISIFETEAAPKPSISTPAATTPVASITQPASSVIPSPVQPPTPTSSSNSIVGLVVGMGVGLVILTIALILVVIYVRKKFKQF